MKNSSNMRLQVAIKFMNIVLLLGILFSVSVVILYVYRLFFPADGPYPDYMLSSLYTYYLKIIFIGGFIATLCGLGLKLKSNLKVILLVLFVIAGISVYGLEAYLVLRTNNFNLYFGVDRFLGRSYYGGSYDKSRNDNNYMIFSASGMDFIVINLDLESDASELQWADNLLQTYSDRRAIVVSHYILSKGIEPFATMNSSGTHAFSPQGNNIYNALKDNPNLFLLLCGHMRHMPEGRRRDVYDGNIIHSLMANYQNPVNGGNGFLRILHFSPAKNEIQVKTYSPLLDKWETDSNSEFILNYNMSGQSLSSIEDQITNEGTASDPENGKDFTIIAIPDTQYYAEHFPDTFNTQMQWIVDSRDAWNIVYVAHEGDVVHRYYDINQWKKSDSALTILENAVSERFPDGIPYGIAPGNHDIPGPLNTKIIDLYNIRMMLYPDFK